MVKPRYIPDRGDVVWIYFNPQRGHEQANRRPAVILSSRPYNEKSGLLLACPITSKVRKYPFEVEVEDGKITGAILVNQIRSFDWRARKPRFIQRLQPKLIIEARECILQVLTD